MEISYRGGSVKPYAKEHSLDIPHFSCIEFPLKVNNIDRAFQMVGGKEAIIRSCQDETSNPLELRFTKNIYEHPVNAKLNNAEQILIKVSVPKKALEENSGDLQKTLSLMHQQKKAIHVAPVAIVNRTFRFREMSDFQYQARTSQFTQTINKSIHSLNYDNIKKLDFTQDEKPWAPEENGLFELPPPPRFSSIPLPFNYQYKKNSATVIKEGKLTTKNKHIKLHSIIIRWEDEVPREPIPELKAQLQLFKSVPTNEVFKDTLITIDKLTQLFAIKPIWVRKHLEALLDRQNRPCLKHALPQVAYTYTKGPWRQSYIRFGVDPKTSSDYARYQTENFRVPNFTRTLSKDYKSDVVDGVASVFRFNGEILPATLSFQLENLTDPDVVDILNQGKFRKECDFYDGWYDTLVMTRVRRLMRYKLRCLVEGTRINENRVNYFKNKLEIQEDKDDKEDKEDKDNRAVNDLDDDEDDDALDPDVEEGYELDISDANHDEILKYLEKFNPRGADEIRSLTGLLRQRDLDI